MGLFLGIILQNIYTSEQFPDLIIFNGIEYEIGVYPMETYFEIYPSRRPGRIGRNSALDRGYRARYEIINNELILIDIETMRLNGNWRKISNRHFKNRIKINIFSGKINLFNGERTGIYMAFTPIYENYIVLNIIEGHMISIDNINCFEYIESIIKNYSEDSFEHNYFSRLLNELYERK